MSLKTDSKARATITVKSTSKAKNPGLQTRVSQTDFVFPSQAPNSFDRLQWRLARCQRRFRVHPPIAKMQEIFLMLSNARQNCNRLDCTLPLSRSHFDLGFFGSKDSPPDIPILVEPYPLGGGPWWRFVDTYTGRPFAGRFSGAETDYLVRFFKTWHGPVGLIDFGAAAARAIEICHTEFEGVAA